MTRLLARNEYSVFATDIDGGVLESRLASVEGDDRGEAARARRRRCGALTRGAARIRTSEFDLRKDGVAEALVGEAGAGGDLHVLVNCAGIVREGFLSQQTDEDWDRCAPAAGAPAAAPRSRAAGAACWM